MTASGSAPNPMINQDRRAVEASRRVLAAATPSDWSRPTPCDGWELRDLVAHMTVQHRGFAAAVRGAGPDPEPWQPGPAVDSNQPYDSAADDVTTAFAEPGVLDRSVWLAEFSTTAQFPAAKAISFHLLDYVVHTWDVARTLDIDVDLDDDVVEAALAVALQVPDGEGRLREGAAFKPSVEAGSEPSALDRTLAWVGRSPGWRRP